jgi:hypothetical protein
MNDNIWFTYKARIRAHERLAENDLHSQFLLVWYAIAGVCLSIVSIRHPKALGDDTDIIAAMFSAAVLAFSMLVTNRDFRGRGIEMRRNYLALQELYSKVNLSSSTLTPVQISDAYQRLLDSNENHADIDDKYFRVFHRGALTSRQPTSRETKEVVLYLCTRIILLGFFYALPLLVVLRFNT